MTLTFTANTANEQKTASIPLVADQALEETERFLVNLALVATPLNVTVQPSTCTVEITNDDSKTERSVCNCPHSRALCSVHTGATIGFDPTAYSVDEEAGAVTFVVKVLIGTLMRSLVVDFSTTDGTAIGRSEVVSEMTSLNLASFIPPQLDQTTLQLQGL